MEKFIVVHNRFKEDYHHDFICIGSSTVGSKSKIFTSRLEAQRYADFLNASDPLHGETYTTDYSDDTFKITSYGVETIEESEKLAVSYLLESYLASGKTTFDQETIFLIKRYFIDDLHAYLKSQRYGQFEFDIIHTKSNDRWFSKEGIVISNPRFTDVSLLNNKNDVSAFIARYFEPMEDGEIAVLFSKMFNKEDKDITVSIYGTGSYSVKFLAEK